MFGFGNFKEKPKLYIIESSEYILELYDFFVV